jgi:23S rRNA (uracil1939-C5)-methyltransferase
MARTKKRFEQLRMSDITVKGQTLSADFFGERRVRVDSSVLIPGDLATVEEIRRRKDAFDGRLVELIEASPDRTEPWCPHFRSCGGCSWQHASYEAQLRYKGIILRKALADHEDLPSPEAPVLPSPRTIRYRNKLEYSFSTRRWFEDPDAAGEDRRALGFFVPRQNNRVVDIRECFHQEDISDRLRNRVRELALEGGWSFHDPVEHRGLLRTLVIRVTGTGEVMVTLVLYEKLEGAVDAILGKIRDEFPEVSSLYYVINGKMNDAYGDCPAHHYAGETAVYECLGEKRFRIGPQSFFQVNPAQTLRLYDLIGEYANFRGDELVYDLYTGTGSIALYLADRVKKVIGVEYVESAVADARINAGLNDIRNCEFHSGDMKDILTSGFLEEKGRPDVLICDPPRAGMHPDVLETILSSGAERLVYVSCNPVSLGRDLKTLRRNYRVLRYRGVDMSPQTPHLETVMLLERKSDSGDAIHGTIN